MTIPMELRRSLPLYKGIGFSDQPEEPCIVAWVPNPGLLFDKYIDTWAMENLEFREQKPSSHHDASTKAKAGGKRTFLDEGAKRGCNNAGLAEYHERRNKLFKMLDVEPIPFQTDWRFVSGLGSGHPYETGFVWHRTLGVPYLPGSSVKGLIRAWAEQWTDTWNEFEHLFGNMDKTGTLIVFDAIPVVAPTLKVDIMNPHYGDYYSKKRDTNQNLIPPADYLSPKPVFFLTVAEKTKFAFALAPRRLNNKSDLTKGSDFLTEALTHLGAGAKTAVGYGRMVTPESLAQKWLDTVMGELRNNMAYQGQPEETFWKKILSEQYLLASAEIKEYVLPIIQKKWKELNIDWDNPAGDSAVKAKRNFLRV